MPFNKRYKIPQIPPSNNQFIGRTNHWDYQNIKKKWAQYVEFYCNPKPSKPIEKTRVTLVYHFTDNRSRDPDNYSGKMILDGLTKAGIISDDSFFHIDLQIKADYSDKSGETEIYIEEVS